MNNTAETTGLNIEILNPPMDAYFWHTVARHQYYRLSKEQRNQLIRFAKNEDFGSSLSTSDFFRDEEKSEKVHRVSWLLGVLTTSRRVIGDFPSMHYKDGESWLEKNEGDFTHEVDEWKDKHNSVKKGVFSFLRWLAIEH